MPTSGITKTFIVLGKEQTEKFANAIEDSYQESLHRKESLDFEITYLHGADEVKRFMEKRKKKGSMSIVGVGFLRIPLHS